MISVLYFVSYTVMHGIAFKIGLQFTSCKSRDKTRETKCMRRDISGHPERAKNIAIGPKVTCHMTFYTRMNIN